MIEKCATWMLSEVLTDRMIWGRMLRQVRDEARGVSGRRQFQAEEEASAEFLKAEHVRPV